MLWTKSFWKDAFERAVRAAANTMVGIMTVNNIPALPGYIDDWRAMIAAVGAAALASVLMSISASSLNPTSPNASFVKIKGDDKGSK